MKTLKLGKHEFKWDGKNWFYVRQLNNDVRLDLTAGQFVFGVARRENMVKEYHAYKLLISEPYFSDQYGAVYERGDRENTFVGKLNGRTLKQFIRDIEAD